MTKKQVKVLPEETTNIKKKPTNIKSTKKKPIKKPKLKDPKQIPVEKDPELKPINHKQLLFCEEYIKTNNATQSYLTVYKCKTENTARTNSCKLLTHANIKAYIEERLKPVKEEEIRQEQKAIADADEVLQFFTKVVRGEITDQLGLETSVRDRISAGKELGKRYGLFKDPDDNPADRDIMPEIKITVVDNSNLEKDLYESNK
jgi:phage terminase small subunit